MLHVASLRSFHLEYTSGELPLRLETYVSLLSSTKTLYDSTYAREA